MEIRIPDPSLVVLVGPAGAGKTTFAARHFTPAEVLSSDAYRAILAGDAADQSVTGAAFGRLHRALSRRLADRLLTVVDATNVEGGARRQLLRRASAAGLPAVAIVLDLPPELVLARNRDRRGRVVEERIVRRHLARLRSTLDAVPSTLGREGFSRVIVLRDPVAIETVRLVRVAS